MPGARTNPSKVLTRSSHLPQVTARGDDDDIDGGDGVDRQLVRMGYRFLVRGCKGL